MSFEEIWDRIRKETKLKKITELAELAETSQPNVSKKKKENNFPVDWAYKIAKKYELNIEWILEGTGPQRPGQGSDDPEIIKQIVKWIKEQERKEPGALAWFTYDFRKKYPEFDRWEKREEDSSADHNAGIKSNTA
jgi:pyruvate-formate lyase-activating enzyme